MHPAGLADDAKIFGIHATFLELWPNFVNVAEAGWISDCINGSFSMAKHKRKTQAALPFK
jgi:hypothetical protein